MDLAQALEEYQHELRTRRGAGGEADRAAVELLREYLVEHAGLAELAAVTVADLEDLFARWYLSRDDADPEAAPRLVAGVVRGLRWLDTRSQVPLEEPFAP